MIVWAKSNLKLTYILFDILIPVCVGWSIGMHVKYFFMLRLQADCGLFICRAITNCPFDLKMKFVAFDMLIPICTRRPIDVHAKYFSMPWLQSIIGIFICRVIISTYKLHSKLLRLSPQANVLFGGNFLPSVLIANYLGFQLWCSMHPRVFYLLWDVSFGYWSPIICAFNLE